VSWSLEDFEVLTARDRKGALAELRRQEPPVVTLDLGLPPDAEGVTEGMATLREILTLAPYTKVIVITGNGEREHAIRAVGMGAYDFLTKPTDLEKLKLILERAYEVHELEHENLRLAQGHQQSPLEGIIAGSPQMGEVCRMVEKVAPANATTFLSGESGTGKELIARALHNLSPRSQGPFVAINCAAIQETLLESELFGYEKGAFTGANAQTRGKFEYAHGGTLFLDEIGDLPFSLQAKLLRFLQERVIERVGGRAEIPVDVRVVAATNQDLEQRVEQGLFRPDLYYRITEVTIPIPPLREREGDLPLLARAFLERFAGDQGKRFKGFTPEALQAIEGYSWPGNVRELENRIKRAIILAEGAQVTADDLELSPPEENPLPFNLRKVREDAEKRALARGISHANGNLSRASELMGITRPTLYALLNKYEMRPKAERGRNGGGQ
jgi:two-component system NtrC family response regulator